MSENTNSVAISYFIDFVNNIRQLNHQYAMFCNVMQEASAKFGEEVESVGPSEKKIILDSNFNMAYYFHQIYVKYSNVAQLLGIPKAEQEKYEREYTEVVKTVILDREKTRKHVIGINNILQKLITSNLTDKSEEFARALSGSGQSNA